jgi:putative membrane-bound dehydrogenase-like protein
MAGGVLAAVAIAVFAAQGPLSPEEERASFELADPELVVELVASEPDVASPVAIAWDERGNLFVAEMTDYPLGPPSGRIRLLRGYQGEGRFRKTTLFAEGLAFPTSVLPWRGGILVSAAPYIWFLKDSDGDGVADERRVVLMGFGEGNQQLRVNGLHRGLDGLVYGANGRSNGSLRGPEDPPPRAIVINQHDFRFLPDSIFVEPIAGFSQFGLAMNDRSERFPSWNTVPVRQVVLEERHVARLGPSDRSRTVAEIIPLADVQVFPRSLAPQTFNRESVRAFNASAGTTIYRGDALGPAYAGNVFVGETLTNLVHRRILKPRGVTYSAERGEQGREFLAAADGWFHPVNFATGPDGALYVVDFYRRWVEHPDYVPRESRGGIDWREGADRGRIWRIRRKSRALEPWPDLAALDTARLVETLDSPNGWMRDTAQRLIEEQAKDDARRLLGAMVRKCKTPAGRFQALWALRNMQLLDTETLLAALGDGSSEVREQALRVCEGRLGEGEGALRRAVLALAGDPEIRVRLRVAIALAGLEDEASRASLAGILQRDAGDEWVRRAVLGGLGGEELAFLDLLVREDPSWLTEPGDGRVWVLRSLGERMGAGDDLVLGGALRWIVRSGDGGVIPGRLALLAGLVEGMRRTGRSLAELIQRTPESLGPALRGLEAMLDGAERVLESGRGPGRVLALEILIAARPEVAAGLLPRLLRPEVSEEEQRAAARGIALLDREDVSRRALEGLDTLSTRTRRAVLGALGQSPAQAMVLVEAVESGDVSPAELDPALRAVLSQLPDADLRKRLDAVLGALDQDRALAVKRYQQAIAEQERQGIRFDAKRGGALFARHCTSCHQLGTKGHAVGPSLAGVGGRPRDALIDDILNPSREVSADFRGFVAFTKAGQMRSGLLAADGPSGVLLRGPDGEETFTARGELESLRMTDQSLMPEGLEQQINPTELGDLIEFLRRADPALLP